MPSQTLAPTHLKYRPDVDGIRAVAVLSVVAYHAHLPFVSGGYIGVDVFFVISGYLISAIIMRDIAADRFSIVAFYERRIRRIFPAMLAMFFVVSLVASWLLLPGELMAFARSLLAALFSGSNFLFWHQVDYFDTAAEYKPLIHTWSLAVEEQFYLLFPPFLLLLRKFAPRYLKPAIFIVAGASLLGSIFVVSHNLAAAFYFTPLRMWELLLGTILSQHYLPQLRSALTRNLASAAGLVLIMVPVVRYTETTLFPGLSALPPCLGACLIIAAGETGSSVVGRILSWRPVVFIGLISYSLYLWHWPVIVFQSTNYILVPYRYTGRHVIAPAILLVSFALATLSWKYVEQPFRSGGLRLKRRSLFLASACSVAVLSIVAVALIVLHGIPKRFPPDAQTVAAYVDFDAHFPWRKDVCFISSKSTFKDFRPDVCLAQHPGRRSLLLLGDSHSASLYPALQATFPDRDIMQATAAGCRILLHEPKSQSADCKSLASYITGDFLLHHKVDTLVLAGKWSSSEYTAIGETVAWAQQRGIPTVVVGRNPEWDAPLPRLLANQIRFSNPEPLAPHFKKALILMDRDMADLSRTRWNVPFVSYFDAYCKPDCPVYAAPLAPMDFDDSHLTIEGGAMFDAALRTRVLAMEANPATPAPVVHQ